MKSSTMFARCFAITASLLVFGVLSSASADEAPRSASSRAATDEKKPQSSDEGKKQHPLVPAIKLAKEAEKAIAAVSDYEALFTKTELVGRTRYASQMQMKYRNEPFSVYLRFHGNNDGREVLYVEGQNANKLLAHEGSGIKSIVGTVTLDPRESRAMAEGRHPITEIGMLKMVSTVIKQWEAESKLGETDVKLYPDAKLGDAECKVIESSHPVPRRQFKFHLTRLYIDKKTGFPIRIEQYGFPAQAGGTPPAIEEYTYTNVRSNVGLADVDFSKSNPRYRFQ